MLDLLLYGSKHFSFKTNNLILSLGIKFIFATEGFA